MKKKSVFLSVCVVLIASAAFAKNEPPPPWVTNPVVPNEEFLRQRGTGATADEARLEAAAALARYFKASVSANLGSSVQGVSDDVSVKSEVNFFTLEYTEPFFYKKKWHCMAFIRCDDAWAQFKPYIKLERSTFLGQYESAKSEKDPFVRLSKCTTAQEAGKTFLERLDYGRVISPKNEAKYSGDREKVASIPVLFEASKKECVVFVSSDNERNGAIAQAVSSALSLCGFAVTKTAAGASHTASVEVEDNAIGSDPIAIKPSVNIKITGTGGRAVYSCETTAGERTVSYTLDGARKKAYPKLAQKIKDAIQKDLDYAFKL